LSVQNRPPFRLVEVYSNEIRQAVVAQPAVFGEFLRGFCAVTFNNTDTGQMLRTVIVEQKSSQSGRRKTITRTFEHELHPSERARLDKSELNKQSEQASLVSETFKPQAQ
jgi:hypothetical protein